MAYDCYSETDRKDLALRLEIKLKECGFVLEEMDASTKEKVYSRPVNETGLWVQVYTSIVGNQVRGHGEDAIRVAGVYRSQGSTRGITSDLRINRVGEIEEIIDRVYQRMRTSWKSCSTVERCSKCQAPLFLSKNKNMVCADFCWTKKEAK